MPTLNVPNAQLFYKTFGSGLVLLIIIGAQSTGHDFHDAASLLAQNYTVV